MSFAIVDVLAMVAGVMLFIAGRDVGNNVAAVIGAALFMLAASVAVFH